MNDPDDVEMLGKEDLDSIREIGSRIIRNLSLFMDNPFQYAHLISACEQDISNLDQIRSRCGLSGDGLLPTEPLSVQGGTGGAGIASVLLDAGFARLREVVDDAIAKRPGDMNE